MKKMIDIPFGSSRYDDLVELRYKVPPHFLSHPFSLTSLPPPEPRRNTGSQSY